MDSGDVSAAYTRLAGTYIDLFGSGEGDHPDDLDLIRRHLTVPAGVVLDLGSGPGHLTRWLADGGTRTVGFDLVPEFVRHAHEAHPQAGFAVAPMSQLPLANASGSGALCWYSLIHVEPTVLGSVLREIRRVLTPGAPLVVGFFLGDVVEAFEHKVATAYRWPVDVLADHLAAAGFEEVARERRGARGDRHPQGVLVVRATTDP